MKKKLIVIGAGPAGYTAAIYGARSGLDVVQILGSQPGGQLMITTDVENYPGFAEVIQGPWLMEQMQKQAQNVGAQFLHDIVERVDFKQKPFKCFLQNGSFVSADSVILATGAVSRWLGIEGEDYFRGFGVSGCATCDGFFFKNRNVAVVGGGNSAVEEALYLTNHAEHVTLIHRKDTLKAEKIAQDRLSKNKKISIQWNTIVKKILGENTPKRVTHLELSNTKTHDSSTLSIDGLFVAIGHDPMSKPFKGQVDLDSQGYIKTYPGTTKTSVPGVFASGDVQDKIFRQAVTAAGQGCMAALEAEKFLSL